MDSNSFAEKYRQYLAAISAFSLTISTGLAMGWSSPSSYELKNITNSYYDFALTKEEYSWVSSSINLGPVLVIIPITFLLNKFMVGRKSLLLTAGIPIILGWILIILATDFFMLLFGRILIGIYAGILTITTPVFVREIVDAKIKKKLKLSMQFMTSIGVLISYISGSILRVFILSLICVIISLVLEGLFLNVPESPLYLVMKDKDTKAEASIKWLNCGTNIKDLQEKKKEKMAYLESFGLRNIFKETQLLKLAIVMGVNIFQQTSGFRDIIFYTTDIFVDADTGIGSDLQTIIIGSINVLMSFLALLFFNANFIRSSLLISGLIMCLSAAALSVYFFIKQNNPAVGLNLKIVPIISIASFILGYYYGFGPGTLKLTSSLCASDGHDVIFAVGLTVNWLFSFIVTKVFSNLNDSIGLAATFLVTSGLNFLSILFVYFLVPHDSRTKEDQEENEIITVDP